MSDWAERQCRHLPEGTPALAGEALAGAVQDLPGWAVEAGGQLARTFAFEDHYEAAAFVGAVAWISHRQDHHPDITLGYNRVTIRYSTHTVKGLSENDLICAAKVERLLKA
jgi:4a-hydroxytetrahydrobiopterin dehydratase